MTSDITTAWIQNSSSCDAFLQPMVPHFVRYLQARTGGTGSLLDAGCGDGHNANAFQKMGLSVTGIDYAQDRISSACARYPAVRFSCANLQARLPFDDDTFDVVFSCSVLQYLDHSVLEEYRRVLKNKGILILIENLRSNPIARTARIVLRVTGYKYQSYAQTYLTFEAINRLKTRFADPEVHFFHLLTPLVQWAALRKGYGLLSKCDGVLLRCAWLRRWCWLTLFVAENRK